MTKLGYNGVQITEEDLRDGYSASEIFAFPGERGYTFDDVIALPGQIDFSVEQVEVASRITRNIPLAYPLASSPMDTVTEAKMAIAMALQGCIGILHHNNTIEKQVEMVTKVKSYENGFIEEPAVLSPNHLVSDLDELKRTKTITGVPITIDGKLGSKLVGLCTKRDTDLVEDRSEPLSKHMTPVENLIVGRQGTSVKEAQEHLKACKKGYLPIVDANGNLCALTTRTDLRKSKDFPDSTKDALGKLRVGAAVGPDATEHERIARLVEAGVDVLCVDERNGYTVAQCKLIQHIKAKHPGVDVIGGNVVTVRQAKALIEAGADGLKVGMGAGSVSNLQQVRAVGRAQISSIFHVSRLAQKYGVPVIADGGVMNTGCAIKALTLGASVVMMGSLLAGTEEAPGEYIFRDGIRVKHYQAMSSVEGRKRRGEVIISRLSSAASGVSGVVVDRGSLHRFIPYMVQSIRHGFQDLGVPSLMKVHEGVLDGSCRFELRSASAQKEGGVHDLHSYTRKLFA